MTTPPPTPDTPATGEQDPDQPLDTKAQFRAALDRKRQREQSGNSGAAGDSKIQGAHGAAGARRVFRRKSG